MRCTQSQGGFNCVSEVVSLWQMKLRLEISDYYARNVRGRKEREERAS